MILYNDREGVSHFVTSWHKVWCTSVVTNEDGMGQKCPNVINVMLMMYT